MFTATLQQIFKAQLYLRLSIDKDWAEKSFDVKCCFEPRKHLVFSLKECLRGHNLPLCALHLPSVLHMHHSEVWNNHNSSWTCSWAIWCSDWSLGSWSPPRPDVTNYQVIKLSTRSCVQMGGRSTALVWEASQISDRIRYQIKETQKQDSLVRSNHHRGLNPLGLEGTRMVRREHDNDSKRRDNNTRESGPTGISVNLRLPKSELKCDLWICSVTSNEITT